MKWLTFFLIMFFSFPLLAADSAPWWKFWQDDDQAAEQESEQITEQGSEEITQIADSLFTKAEKNILQEFLHSQNLENDNSEYGERDKKNKKGKKQKNLPPGLQKKLARGGQLPPGWQKKVARGEVLDEDIYEASSGLPKSILDRLPSGPDGTSIRYIEDKVVRIVDATREILDVFSEN